MKIITEVHEVQNLSASWRQAQSSIGFVPTMGALHQGHAELIRRSKRECDKSVVSIFVNPTQFNDPNDLSAYPQPRQQDLILLRELQVDAVFMPEASTIYNDQNFFFVNESSISKILCGPSRPGHFNGVLTVVLKLFNIVKADRAYFGEKDFQQFQLIRNMVKAFFLPVEVVGCATVREADGLAMSSRNLNLTPMERERAPLLYRILTTAPSTQSATAQLVALGFKVDYVEEHWGRRFAAAWLGKVRLIDNVER